MRTLICLIVVLFGAKVTLFSQNTTQYTLSSVVDLAVAHSSAVKKAQLDRQVLDARMREQRSMALPQVQAGVSADYYPVLPTQFIPGTVVGQPEGVVVPVQYGQPWQVTGVLSAEQVLYTAQGRRMAPAAAISENLADLLITRSQEEVIAQTATTYHQLLQTRQLLRSVDANLGKFHALQRMAELQLKNGYITPTDVKRIKVAITNLDTKRQNLLTGIEALRQTLQWLCGIDAAQPFDVAEDLTPPGADSLRWLTLMPQPESTVESRLVQQQLRLSEVQQHSAKAADWPIVSARASGWLQRQSNTSGLFQSGHPWYGMAFAGVQVKANIFDGFRKKHQLQQLSLNHQKLLEDFSMINNGKMLEFRLAKDQLQSALRDLRIQSENVALATEITDKLTLQYKEGITPLSDLLNAQTAQTEAETNYFQQIFTYRIAVVKLAKSAGKVSEIKK